MEALKFDTTILENGIIQIPELAGFANSLIEISIVVKHKQPDTLRDTKQSQSVDEFFEKWAGFLKNKNESDKEWNKFSISSAMRGMESEESLYSLSDLKEIF